MALREAWRSPAPERMSPAAADPVNKNLSGDLGDVFEWDSQFKPIRNEARID